MATLTPGLISAEAARLQKLAEAHDTTEWQKVATLASKSMLKVDAFRETTVINNLWAAGRYIKQAHRLALDLGAPAK